VNLAHLHLLLNHFPTIGFGAGVGLLVAAVLKGSEDLKQASFVAFFVIALVTIPVYLSGNAAEFVLRDRPEVSPAVIAAHQDAAMLALIFMELTGVLAWVGLWRFRRWHLTGLLLLSIVTFALMARAANIGGEIRHPEILVEGTNASEPAWPRAAALGAALITNHPWAWPICEILHFLGLCLLFGVILLVNLRTLGFIRELPFADVHRLLPWAMVGLGVNVVTGMLFFLAAPDQYTQNLTFSVKMGLMLVGGVSLLYPTMHDQADSPKPEPGARTIAKLAAAASIVVWISVIFFGRFLPYLGSE
jgi:uncharacterized membrane protein